MTFAEQFEAGRTDRIDVSGGPVFSIYRRQVRDGDIVRVSFAHARAAPVQGVRLKLHGGSIAVADQKLKDVVLWADTAPGGDTVLRMAGKGELRLWNCWRDGIGVTQAWLGNAGMRVEDAGVDRIRLSCNSQPEITFNDLIVDVTFTA
jgi:hypothetical protein